MGEVCRSAQSAAGVVRVQANTRVLPKNSSFGLEARGQLHQPSPLPQPAVLVMIPVGPLLFRPATACLKKILRDSSDRGRRFADDRDVQSGRVVVWWWWCRLVFGQEEEGTPT